MKKKTAAISADGRTDGRTDGLHSYASRNNVFTRLWARHDRVTRPRRLAAYSFVAERFFPATAAVIDNEY